MLALLWLLSSTVFHSHDVLRTGSEPMHASLRAGAASDGATHLDIWETASGRTVRAFTASMTKLLHTVVVSDDLRIFRHVHPRLLRNGHFAIDLAPLPPGLYHIYIDGVPRSLGRQVFRFDVPLGRASTKARRFAYASTGIAHAGPYVVRLDTTTIAPGEIATIRIAITKHGQPANDLHPYLGAMAHGVFIGTSDLAYMHGHGMDEQMLAMAASDCGDGMMATMAPLARDAAVPDRFAMQVLAPRAQRYDFWLQFIGGTTLYTVPFLITAR